MSYPDYTSLISSDDIAALDNTGSGNDFSTYNVDDAASTPPTDWGAIIKGGVDLVGGIASLTGSTGKQQPVLPAGQLAGARPAVMPPQPGFLQKMAAAIGAPVAAVIGGLVLGLVLVGALIYKMVK